MAPPCRPVAPDKEVSPPGLSRVGRDSKAAAVHPLAHRGGVAWQLPALRPRLQELIGDEGRAPGCARRRPRTRVRQAGARKRPSTVRCGGLSSGRIPAPAKCQRHGRPTAKPARESKRWPIPRPNSPARALVPHFAWGHHADPVPAPTFIKGAKSAFVTWPCRVTSLALSVISLLSHGLGNAISTSI